MSVTVQVIQEQDSEGKEYGEILHGDGRITTSIYGVIGHVIAAVVRQKDGSITLERSIAVSADNIDDNDLAESVVRRIERKLNEEFPDPTQQATPEPKLWVPDGY